VTAVPRATLKGVAVAAVVVVIRFTAKGVVAVVTAKSAEPGA
jgi:hypothetical protein